jgi:predicted kinase
MKKVLLIMRGCPGSGKSHYSNERVVEANDRGLSVQICSADHYFVQAGGTYEFKPHKLCDAHAECLRCCIDALYRGVELVIIDNTNTRLREFETYAKLATAMGYEIQIKELRPSSNSDIETWHQRCLHHVPLDKIRQMDDRWETIPKDWYGAKLI